MRDAYSEVYVLARITLRYFVYLLRVVNAECPHGGLGMDVAPRLKHLDHLSLFGSIR
jgi:hypothetical protein